jgi:alkanesulfonate monooxygenase SsuD/methylene tetrahydromethanopterin reductase-like flavin-dependent oxidoreductase (luciferase family)
VKFGLGQFTLQVPPWDNRTHAQLYADTLDLAAFADDAGFDSFWLAEHHGAADGYIPSLLPFLAAAGARTSRMQLGTAVMLAPFHDPLRVAEDAAVVDGIAAGRLNVGLGLGWAPEEYRMFKTPTKGRGKRLAEFAQVCKRAWTQERFSFDGEFYSYDDISITPKPARGDIPLWLGGSADAALERAVRYGDGHFPPSTIGNDGIVPHGKRILELRRSLGIEGPYGYGSFLPVGVGADADDGWSRIRDGVLHVRGAYMLWAQGQRDVSGARDAAAPFEDAVRAGCIVGSAAEVAEQMRPLVDGMDSIGFDEVFLSVILAPAGTPAAAARENVQRFATEVMPKLR